MTDRAGCFVVIEGASGIGKTTVAAMLRDELAHRGFPTLATKQPSDSALGKLARQGTDEYRGVVLACLVAADRYYHVERDIRPALRAGYVVVCDRYVPTSLVLQRMDGVETDFVEQLNQYAERPDLTVILTGQPQRSGKRAEDRGIYSRFHRGGQAARLVEDWLYRDVAQQLVQAGYAVLHHEVTDQSAEAVTAVVLNAVTALLDGHSG
ncbi:thymidylate kinase [Candidatus Protofrankia californiensis]|uniref:Thymidylate kinase n=1 Tax=Candidatus Protofrankia californiensis TaxID=1839754 RepID=A0A1C3NZP4_9ACTN|nr:thymidylate kinase [Candidatus Protofrankia californiensis]